MSQIEFEPFGEQVAHNATSDKFGMTRKGPLQSAMLRAGAGTFWVLVVAIVAARALYFNPNFAEVFESVAQASTHLRSIFHG